MDLEVTAFTQVSCPVVLEHLKSHESRMQFGKSARILAREFTANIAARYVMVLSLPVRLRARTDPGRAQVVGGLVQIFAPLYPGTGDHRIVVRRQWLERLERLVPNKKD
jgi:hypothetical protein